MVAHHKRHLPLTRADCANVPRPCPYVSCRYNLYLDATPHGFKLNFPGLEPWEMTNSCALDVAESCGEMTLEQVASMLNVTRERVRQIEARLLRNLSPAMDAVGLRPDPEPSSFAAA